MRFQHGILAGGDGYIGIGFRPAQVERAGIVPGFTFPFQLNGVAPFGAESDVIACGELAGSLDIDFGGNARDADIDPDTVVSFIFTADFRLCGGGNRQVFSCRDIRIFHGHTGIGICLGYRRQFTQIRMIQRTVKQTEDAAILCHFQILGSIRAYLCIDFRFGGNVYVISFDDGGAGNINGRRCLIVSEIASVPFRAGTDRRVTACRVNVCLVNDDRALRLEGFRFRRYTDSRQCDIALAERSGDHSRRGIDLHQLFSIFIGGFLRCVSACIIHMRADSRTVQRYIACAHDHIALGIDLPFEGNVTAAGDCFRLFGGGLLQMAFHTAIVQSFAIGGIRAQRQPSHVEYTVLADRDAGIREEIHVPADLVILDRIHDAVDVDLILDDIDLVIRLSHMEICHIVLREREIRELIQRIAIVDLLIRDVILLAAIGEGDWRLNSTIILLIRHCHVRIDEIASRAPACDGKEQCRPCAGKDVPPPARTLLALMGLHQLRSDHIAAARRVPYYFVYFVHKTVLLWVRRSWK